MGSCSTSTGVLYSTEEATCVQDNAEEGLIMGSFREVC